jgi:hypothetical protein
MTGAYPGVPGVPGRAAGSQPDAAPLARRARPSQIRPAPEERR